MMLGDSISKGFCSDGPGPTPTAGTVYEYNGSAIVQVGANDLSNASNGSMWPKWGIDYFAGSGYKPVISSCGVNSSRFNSTTASLSWDTNGTPYGLAKTKTDAALVANGTTKIRACVIHLGENEYSNATIATSLTAITSLINRINADYDTPKIYIDIPGIKSEQRVQHERE